MSDRPLQTAGSTIIGARRDASSFTPELNGVSRIEKPVRWNRPRDEANPRQRALGALVPLLADQYGVLDQLPIAGSTSERVKAVVYDLKTANPSAVTGQESHLKWQGAIQTANSVRDAISQRTKPALPPVLPSLDKANSHVVSSITSGEADSRDVHPLELAQTMALPLPLPIDILSVLQRASVTASPSQQSALASPQGQSASMDNCTPLDENPLLNGVGASPANRLRLTQHLLDRIILLASQHFRSSRQPMPTVHDTSTTTTTELSGTGLVLGGPRPQSEALAQYYCSCDVARALSTFYEQTSQTPRSSGDTSTPGNTTANSTLGDSVTSLFPPTPSDVLAAGSRLRQENAILTATRMEASKIRADLVWMQKTPLLIELDGRSFSQSALTSPEFHQTTTTHSHSPKLNLPSLGELAQLGMAKRMSSSSGGLDRSEIIDTSNLHTLRENVLSGLRKRDALRGLSTKLTQRRAAAVSRYAARFVYALSKHHNTTLKKRLAVATALHKEHRLTHMLHDISMGLADEAIRNAVQAIISHHQQLHAHRGSETESTTSSPAAQDEVDSSQSPSIGNDPGSTNTQRSRSTTPAPGATPHTGGGESMASPRLSLPQQDASSVAHKSPIPAATALVAALGGETYIRERAIAAGLLLSNGMPATPANAEKLRQQQALKEQMQQQHPYLSRREAQPPPPPPLPLHAFPVRFYLDLALEYPPFPLALALSQDMLHPSVVRNIKQRMGTALVATLIPSTIGVPPPTLATNPAQYPAVQSSLTPQQVEALCHMDPAKVAAGAQALATAALTPQPPTKSKPPPIMGPQAQQAAQQALTQYETAVSRRQAQMVAALPAGSLANPYFSPLLSYLSRPSRNLAGAHFRIAQLSAVASQGLGPTPSVMREAAGIFEHDGGFPKYNFKWQPSVETLTRRFRDIVLYDKDVSDAEQPPGIKLSGKTRVTIGLDPHTTRGPGLRLKTDQHQTITDLLFDYRDQIDNAWLRVVRLHAQASIWLNRDRAMNEAARVPVQTSLGGITAYSGSNHTQILDKIGGLLETIRRDIRAYDVLLHLLSQASTEVGLIHVSAKEPSSVLTSSQEMIWGISNSALGLIPMQGRRARPSVNMGAQGGEPTPGANKISNDYLQGDPEDGPDSSRVSGIGDLAEDDEKMEDLTLKDEHASDENEDEDEDEDDINETSSNVENAEYSDDCDTADANDAVQSRERRKALRTRARQSALTKEDLCNLPEIERLLLLQGDHAGTWLSSRTNGHMADSGAPRSRLHITLADYDASSTSEESDGEYHDEEWMEVSNSSTEMGQTESATCESNESQNISAASVPKLSLAAVDQILPILPPPRVFSPQLVWIATLLASRKHSLSNVCIIHTLWPGYLYDNQSRKATDETITTISDTAHSEGKGESSLEEDPLPSEAVRLLVPDTEDGNNIINPLSLRTSQVIAEETLRLVSRRRRRLARRYLVAIRAKLLTDLHETKVALHALSEPNYIKWKAEGVYRSQEREKGLVEIFNAVRLHLVLPTKLPQDSSSDQSLSPYPPKNQTAKQAEQVESMQHAAFARAYARSRSMLLLSAFSNLDRKSLTRLVANQPSTSVVQQNSDKLFQLAFKFWTQQAAREAVKAVLDATPAQYTVDEAPLSPYCNKDSEQSSEVQLLAKAYYDVERYTLLAEELEDCLMGVLHGKPT